MKTHTHTQGHARTHAQKDCFDILGAIVMENVRRERWRRRRRRKDIEKMIVPPEPGRL